MTEKVKRDMKTELKNILKQDLENLYCKKE